MEEIIEQKRFESIVNSFPSLPPILVVGDVGLDKYTSGEVRRISPEAPVPVLEVEEEWEKLGLGANVSHNLKTLGIESILCGVVGQDEKGRRLEELLEELELKTWGLVYARNRSTIFKQRIITKVQQICRIDYEGPIDIGSKLDNKLQERVSDLKDGVGAIVVQDYAKGTLSQNLLRSMVEQRREKGFLVTVDPGKGVPPLWYKGADLLKPNLEEAKIMVQALGYNSKEDNLAEIATTLMDKLELASVVITLGKDGMALMEKGGKLQIIPTLAREVYDVSGAGDTAISLLTASLMAQGSLVESAWIGNCGAGVVVAKKGTATVNLEELSNFYHRIRDSYGHGG